MSSVQEWVWDESVDWDDQPVLLVLPRPVYEHWERRLDVLSCSTWGEVRDLGDDVYDEVLGLAGYGTFEEFTQHLAIRGEAPLIGASQIALDDWLSSNHDLPSRDDDFYVDNIGAFADGDWPPDVRYLMNICLPEEIVREHGATYMTVMNGVYVQLKLEDREAILGSLTALGASVTRETGLSRFVEPI